MSLRITLLGTGSPIPSPDRAGPATLISTGDGPEGEHYLVDAGRGVLMRLAACGLGAANLAAVLITHLHSDHITDLNDVITTRWVMTFVESPLTIVGPIGTRSVVDQILASLEPDITYRIAHHDDLDHGPAVTVIEVSEGLVDLPGRADRTVRITCAPTDHKPVEPSIGYRFDRESTESNAGAGTNQGGGVSVVVAGDTVPCAGLDSLCTVSGKGVDALVHTVIRKDIIARIPLQRMQDTLDYHSSPEEAAQTAARSAVGTLVLTHYVPPMPMGGTHDEWKALAAAHFDGVIEVGDDLHAVVLAADL
jgi:ribonuclease Z